MDPLKNLDTDQILDFFSSHADQHKAKKAQPGISSTGKTILMPREGIGGKSRGADAATTAIVASQALQNFEEKLKEFEQKVASRDYYVNDSSIKQLTTELNELSKKLDKVPQGIAQFSEVYSGDKAKKGLFDSVVKQALQDKELVNAMKNLLLVKSYEADVNSMLPILESSPRDEPINTQIPFYTDQLKNILLIHKKYADKLVEFSVGAPLAKALEDSAGETLNKLIDINQMENISLSEQDANKFIIEAKALVNMNSNTIDKFERFLKAIEKIDDEKWKEMVPFIKKARDALINMNDDLNQAVNSDSPFKEFTYAFLKNTMISNKNFRDLLYAFIEINKESSFLTNSQKIIDENLPPKDYLGEALVIPVTQLTTRYTMMVGQLKKFADHSSEGASFKALLDVLHSRTKDLADQVSAATNFEV